MTAARSWTIPEPDAERARERLGLAAANDGAAVASIASWLRARAEARATEEPAGSDVLLVAGSGACLCTRLGETGWLWACWENGELAAAEVWPGEPPAAETATRKTDGLAALSAGIGVALASGPFTRPSSACAGCGFALEGGRCDVCGGGAAQGRDGVPGGRGPGESEDAPAATAPAWPAGFGQRLRAFARELAVAARAPSGEPARGGRSRPRQRRRAPVREARAADGSWTCGHCGHDNSRESRLCFECGYAPAG